MVRGSFDPARDWFTPDTPGEAAPKDQRYAERCTGRSSPSEMREVMWISPDQSQAEGRWFWGEYQEFGIRREAAARVLRCHAAGRGSKGAQDRFASAAASA